MELKPTIYIVVNHNFTKILTRKRGIKILLEYVKLTNKEIRLLP